MFRNFSSNLQTTIIYFLKIIIKYIFQKNNNIKTLYLIDFQI